MKSAPDRTVFLGLAARIMSAGIAGAGRYRDRSAGNATGSPLSRHQPPAVLGWRFTHDLAERPGRPSA